MQRYKIQGKVRQQKKISSFSGFGFVHEFKIFYPEPYSTFNYINLTDCEPCFNAGIDDCILMTSVERVAPKKTRKKKC
jgi:hypothetical protein